MKCNTTSKNVQCCNLMLTVAKTCNIMCNIVQWDLQYFFVQQTLIELLCDILCNFMRNSIIISVQYMKYSQYCRGPVQSLHIMAHFVQHCEQYWNVFVSISNFQIICTWSLTPSQWVTMPCQKSGTTSTCHGAGVLHAQRLFHESRVCQCTLHHWQHIDHSASTKHQVDVSPSGGLGPLDGDSDVEVQVQVQVLPVPTSSSSNTWIHLQRRPVAGSTRTPLWAAGLGPEESPCPRAG